MTVGYEALRAFEGARWARQAVVLRAWLDALPKTEPRADALRCVFAGVLVSDAAAAQLRFDLARDLQRLRAAIEGKTPSAVDPSRPYASLQSFARDEAVHTLDNAAVFLSKACATDDRVSCGAAVERAQRWIQRLRWELVDTEIDAGVPLQLSADAVAVATDLGAIHRVASETCRTLTELKVLLTVSSIASDFD